MSKSILVIDTPKSCDRCPLNQQRDLKLDWYNELHICKGNPKIWYKERYADANDSVKFSIEDIDFYEQRHPQCPLQDTTELLEVLELIAEDIIHKLDYITHQNIVENLNKLRKALGGE